MYILSIRGRGIETGVALLSVKDSESSVVFASETRVGGISTTWPLRSLATCLASEDLSGLSTITHVVRDSYVEPWPSSSSQFHDGFLTIPLAGEDPTTSIDSIQLEAGLSSLHPNQEQIHHLDAIAMAASRNENGPLAVVIVDAGLAIYVRNEYGEMRCLSRVGFGAPIVRKGRTLASEGPATVGPYQLISDIAHAFEMSIEEIFSIDWTKEDEESKLGLAADGVNQQEQFLNGYADVRSWFTYHITSNPNLLVSESWRSSVLSEISCLTKGIVNGMVENANAQGYKVKIVGSLRFAFTSTTIADPTVPITSAHLPTGGEIALGALMCAYPQAVGCSAVELLESEKTGVFEKLQKFRSEVERVNPFSKAKSSPHTLDKWHTNSLMETPLTLSPYPHIFAEHVLNAKYYDELVSHLPPDDAYTSLRDTKRVSGAYPRERQVFFLASDAYLNRLDAPRRDFWLHAREWFTSAEFRDEMLSIFGEHARPLKPGEQYFVEPQLSRDHTNYFFRPHTDIPPIVISAILYLPKGYTAATFGTSIYEPIERLKTSDGSRHGTRLEFRKVRTAPYFPNSMFAFAKSDTSWHGVELIDQPDVIRDTLLWTLIAGTPEWYASYLQKTELK